ncbi:MAG: RagB/SusD family nutrient uptake outer membrane protein [Bacteroidales bacterium]|nr:RagB/SusD family nutrient uptake outer membrane protein [Bacteroidales bacterium]
MKKNLKYITAIFSAALLLSACDNLDRFPKDKMSPETFLTNETEMQAYSNAFYTIFPGSSVYENYSDELISKDLSLELRGGRTLTSGDWTWTKLRNINTLIEYSGNCKDEKIRVQYVALARFFRAFFYFEKVKEFGDVPWYDHTLGSDDPELRRPRDNRDYVMQRIIEDLDYAILNLPSAKSDYRVTKWTALAFKSRVCLFEGTYRKYHAGDVTLATLPASALPYQHYLEQAAAAADEFMTTSGYGLYSGEADPAKNYIGLFTKYRVSEGTNREVILARNYNIDYSVVHGANSLYTSSTSGRAGFTRKIMNCYLMADGTRFTDQAGHETMQFVAECQGRDPRFSQSIRTPGYVRLGSNPPIPAAPDLAVSVTGYCPIKYFMGTSDDISGGSHCDLILFRAGEVYLNFAEAKAELDDLTQSDLNRSVKLLRDRVGMPPLDKAIANANPDPYMSAMYPKVAQTNTANVGVILEIRRERMVELLQEGFRYYDVMRWAEGHTFESPLYGLYFPGEGSYDLNADGVVDVILYNGDTPPAGTALKLKIGRDVILSNDLSGYLEFHKNTRPGWTWDDGKDYLYPIPPEQRSLTGGALTQNPGWVDGLPF